jgi:hypothetical protein
VGSDIGIVLSTYFENLAAAMLERMATRESQDDAVSAAAGCRACALPARLAAV